MNKDRELLFAVLALQMNFITKEQLVEAGALWASEPQRGLSEILMEKGYLKDDEQQALEVMANAHAKRFGAGDPGASLQSMSIPADVKESLLGIKDMAADVKDALNTLAETSTTGAETIILTRAERERYAFKGELGRGGLGKVMRAVDTDFGREVAVKMMLEGRDSSEQLRRFMREGQVAGILVRCQGVLIDAAVGVQEIPVLLVE